MKHLPTFSSLLAILVLMAEIYPIARLRGHWLVMVYLCCQFAFTLAGWLALQKIDAEHPAYKQLLIRIFAIVAASALCLAAKWLVSMNLQNGVIVVICATVLALSCGIILSKGSETEAYIACGTLYLIPGIIGLLSVASEIGPADTYVRIGLSSFWIAMALLFFAAAASYTNRSLLAIASRLWIPPMVAVVIFGCLALALHGAQKEGSYAAIQVQEAQR